MANIFLAWQNRADEATLSSGSWLTALPLANIQNRQVQKVARTTDALSSSTQFLVTLPQARSISAVGLIVHNLSVGAKVRIFAADSAIAAGGNVLSAAQENDFDLWTKGRTTVNSNAAAAPSGLFVADEVVETAASGSHILNITTGTWTDNASAVLEVEVRRGVGTRHARLQILGKDNVIRLAVFDLTTGAVALNTGASSANAQSLGGGWWRLRISATVGAGVTSVQAAILMISGTTTGSYLGDGVSSLYLSRARWYEGNDPIHDSPYVDVWPAGIIPQDLLEWEDDNFWLGTLSAEQRAGYQSPFIYLPQTTVTAQYWRIEIYDEGNTAGYVQIGRLFMAQGWRPAFNYSYGSALGYQDPSPVDTSLSGAEYFDVRSKYRVMNFTLQYISDTEAYSYALQLQRLAGISGEVLVVPNSDETLQQPLRAFVGRLQQIGAVRQPQPSAYTVDFAVKELL